MEHPEINRIQRLGYPDPEFHEWELRQAFELETEDDEIWPDGLTHAQWQKEKRTPARVSAS